MTQRQPRVRDSGYLEWLHGKPCCICRTFPVEAAHIRFTRVGFPKRSTGMAEKPDDKWAVPVCPSDHRTGPNAQHSSNEREWWERHGIDPLILAQQLYAEYGGEIKTRIFRNQRKKSSRPIQSRGFPKNIKRTMDGRVLTK